MKVHHIGYLVKDYDKACVAFKELGYHVSKEKYFDEDRNAEIGFMGNGQYCVELIRPSGKESPLYPLLKQYKNTPYHICYEVANLYEAIEELKKKKFMMFKEPQRALAIGDNAQVAFLMNAKIGMIELVQL